MGTSQSFKLKSNPNWTSAKKAMTKIASGTGDMSVLGPRFISNFRAGLGDGLYTGSRGQRGRSSFGRSGGVVLRGFVGLVHATRQNGIWYALNIEPSDPSKGIRSKREILDDILLHVKSETEATFDDAAALNAMNHLLIYIFCNCDNEIDINERLHQATDDELCEWIIRYQVKYILEYSAEIFQSHIFDKSEHPEVILGQIENWLRSEIERRMSEQIKQIDLQTEEGKQTLDTLTAQILDIWQPE